VTQNQA